MNKLEKRTKKEYKVLKLEFSMGDNDRVDINAGGPPTLSFWVSVNLPREVIERVAKDGEVQSTVKAHGGDGSFAIKETWAESFIETEETLKAKCLKWAKEF